MVKETHMSTRSGFTPLFLMLSLAWASPHALAENLHAMAIHYGAEISSIVEYP